MKLDSSPYTPSDDFSSLGQINIAIFCGGRGSATIINELLQWPNIHLTLIVNAYDDGLSTGALRKFISEMLGPSDFRKNLSYLLDPYSKEQYALKDLLELRFPQSTTQDDIMRIQEFTKTNKVNTLTEPLQSLFRQISHDLSRRVCSFLEIFFNYTHTTNLVFDYRDCSLGNLIFAGAYLEQKSDFNAAAKEISQLVSSRALLVNASGSENRILVGLKEDGELLMTEAHIVGVQSHVPIRDLFLVRKPIDVNEWQRLEGKSIEEQASWLRTHQSIPNISPEAERALNEADIILYGPGTQHSSLFPSYCITRKVLKTAPAIIKALIMNLGPDHDIQSLSNSDIIDGALKYMDDESNQVPVMTHVLLNDTSTIHLKDSLTQNTSYKNIALVRNKFAKQVSATVHNGRAVVETTLALWEKSVTKDPNKSPSMSFFVDIHKRSLALSEFYEELLEVDWKQVVSKVLLTINRSNIESLQPNDMVYIKTDNRPDQFPEIGYFLDWLQHEKSEYLILLTGDGKYCFRDVILAIKLLEQGHFGAVFGSRNQSRVQFKTSLRAAYGEKKILSTLSFLGSFLVSALFALRCGTLFSDPLTGFRIFKRSRIISVVTRLKNKKITTPIGLAACLIKNNIEIAELPVTFRTFSGFVDPHWRIRRGLQNLLSTIRRHIP